MCHRNGGMKRLTHCNWQGVGSHLARTLQAIIDPVQWRACVASAANEVQAQWQEKINWGYTTMML